MTTDVYLPKINPEFEQALKDTWAAYFMDFTRLAITSQHQVVLGTPPPSKETLTDEYIRENYIKVGCISMTNAIPYLNGSPPEVA